MEKFQSEGKDKPIGSKNTSYQHKSKKSKQSKIESSQSSKIYGDSHRKNLQYSSDSSKGDYNSRKIKFKPYEEILGEFKKIKSPNFNGETKKGEEAEAYMSGMKKYFQIYNYSNQLKERMSIYNLIGKADIQWQDLKRVKGIKENNINWSTFKKYFKNKFL